MPIARRALLRAVSLALLPAAAAKADAPPDRILVLGDSQAQGLAGGLQRLYRRERAARVIDRSRIATGLATTAHFDWPASINDITEPERGAIAIVMFGANDRPPMRTPNGLEAFGTSYAAHVRAVARAVHRHCPATIWVGHPIVRDPVYAEDMASLNKLFETNAKAEGADWFPSWPLFVDPAGTYSAFGKGTDGATTRLRADDGVHLTPAGYDVLAKALQPVIAPFRATAE